MPRTASVPTRDAASWPLIDTVFVAVGLLLVATAAMTGDPDAWPSTTALAGGVFVLAGGVLVLFGLLAGLTVTDQRQRYSAGKAGRGHHRPSARHHTGLLG